MSGKKRFSLKDLISAFEKRQFGVINSVIKQITTLFEGKATELGFLYAQRKLIGNRFLPNDVKDTIAGITKTLNAQTKDIIVKGIRQSFVDSNEKNNRLETQTQTSGRRIPPGKKDLVAVSGLYDDEKALSTAVNAFVKRSIEGLNLSQRVFKLSNVWKKTITDTLTEGLRQGTSARALAQLLVGAVRNGPNVANPGQGVYKSPIKNALRLTRNEINLAYANADFERWQVIKSVIGIEVRLSNAHPKYDMCDNLKGRYPKDFHYTRWHVNCLCIAIPVLASQEVRDAIMDYKLGLVETPPIIPYITTFPAQAVQWMRSNADRVNGWKSKPYWIELNKTKVADFFN